MLYYTLSGVINAVTSTILGLIVYSRNKKSPLNRSFALFCLAVATWSWAYIFWPEAPDRTTTLLAFQALHVGAILVPVSYYRFTIVFLGLDSDRNKRRVLNLGYFLVLFFWAFVFTPLYIKDMVPKFSFRYWAEPGILYHFYLLMFFGYAVYCWYLLFRGYQKSSGVMREQIRYVLLGTLIGFVGGSTNYPLWYNINIPPLGNSLVAIYVILVAIAIMKYHLFDIRVVLTELLVLLIASILLVQTLTATTFLAKVLGFGILALFGVAGYFLIRSVIREIELRAKLEVLYGELKKLDDAKSEFISIASHQLRTPLTAVKGYVSMILEKSYGEVPDKMSQPLENVYASNERLIKLVNDILNISKIEAGKMEMEWEKASLEELILDIINELKVKADTKNLYLKYEKPPKESPKGEQVPYGAGKLPTGQAETPIPDITIDKTKIRQVILNIIDNSIKYTEKGGTTVRMQIVDGRLRIVVSDTGVGLEKNDIPRLFESFSRGRNGSIARAEGTGLGLYIARRFIEMHQGRIWAESEGKGKGSTFFIELPIK